MGYKSGNDTLKTWIPGINDLDELLNLSPEAKENLSVRVAYQIPLLVNNGASDIEVCPYTFEDSLVMENKTLFSSIADGNGLLGKMITASKESDVKKSALLMYEAITAVQVKKAEFALELLYIEDPNKLECSTYIKEGLDWLEGKLVSKKDGLINPENNN